MKYLQGLWNWIRAHWKATAALLTAGAVVAVFALAQLIGIFTLERHRGFFAPVWSADGQQVYYLERDTRGLVWGFGWEFFTPPASAYVISDRLTLRRLDIASGKSELLERFDGSPVVGRVTKHYRGSIFNFISARIEPGGQGIDFLVRMDVPRVPMSESWSLAGVWKPGQPSNAKWDAKNAGITAGSHEVLKNGIELMTVRGRESFSAAVLAVEADGSHRVLLHNGDFAGLYPDGVPARQIAERSSRERIERSRELTRVKTELVAKHKGNFAVIGVSLDGSREALDKYLAETPLPWPQIFEPGGLDSRVANQLGILTLPTMILVDEQGKVINRNVQTTELEGELEKVIR